MINDTEKSSLLKAAPCLLQIMRVLARRKFLSSLFGKKNLPPPKEIRETFEELGLVFLKFGQVLAMRKDLLPNDYIKELELLHDDLPAMGISIVHSTVNAELGTPLSQLFLSFTEKPVAAATIAQVHEATMHDGRHVAVKVQRPGLKEIISTDIAALTYLISLGEKLFPKIRAFDLSVVVREFAITLIRETEAQPQSKTARGCYCFGSTCYQWNDSLVQSDGWLASSTRRVNDYHRYFRYSHWPFRCMV